MSSHHAQFTWGVGPQNVTVAGNFNNWSATASPLKKQADGTFSAEVPLPWGEKQAFKYVVDGEWKVREDEAKEWDAAGNMNNVYTAPHVPAPSETKPEHTHAPVAAAAAAAAPSSPTTSTRDTTHAQAPSTTAAAVPASASSAAPASPIRDTAAPASSIPLTSAPDSKPAAISSTNESTKPANLLASSAPAAASSGIPLLGAVAGSSAASSLGSTVPAKGVTHGVTTTTYPTVAAATAHEGTGFSGAGMSSAPVGTTRTEVPALTTTGPTPINTNTSTTSAPAARTSIDKAPSPTSSPIAAVTAGISKLFGTSETAPASTTTSTTAAPAPVITTTNTAPHAAPAPLINRSDPTSVQIQKLAAGSNVGEASANGEHGLLERASEVGGGAVAAIGGFLGSAAAAVERATGIDLTHGEPLSVAEAKARGIDVSNAQRVDGPTDTVSPVGSKPSAAGVSALDEKVQALKNAPATSTLPSTSGQTFVPLSGQSSSAKNALPTSNANTVPGGPSPLHQKDDDPNDIPAQHETKQNHTKVPMPTIVAISAKDPSKDRTLDSTSAQDTRATKPISSNPAIDPKKAKKHAEENPGLPGSSLQSGKTASTGNAIAPPDAPSANVGSAGTKSNAVPLGWVTANATGLADSSSSSKPAAVSATPTPIKKDSPAVAPAPVLKDSPAPAAAAVQPSPVAPSTPAKATPAAAAASTPVGASTTSTPASTPAKSLHGKEGTTDSTHKKKSGFMSKIKNAFHSPKDKK